MVKITIMEDTKPIWKSKTFWVAVLTALTGIFQAIQGQVETGTTLTVLGVLNIVLRKVTDSAVAWK